MRHVIVAVYLCLAITQTSAAETVTLRYGQIPSTVRSVSSLYLFIARERGFFARENVELELIPIPGGTDKMVAALDQATIDVTQTATPYLIQAVLRGIRRGGDRGRNRQSDLQPRGKAGRFQALHNSRARCWVCLCQLTPSRSPFASS